MPNRLLTRYFATGSALAEVDFDALSETKTEALFMAWLELP